MSVHFRQYWQRLQESLWFVPGLLVLAACGLAYGLIEFDSRTSFNGAKRFPLLFGVGAEGSRGMLTAIAGSMLTVAALVFSLTLSTISQVSSQYSPRVLRNFMRDRGNQVVMGYFVGVFAYCLLVLGTIRGSDEQKFVPSTAVLMGLVLALGGVAALIYFIHHIAESLQTSTVLRRISHDTQKAMDVLFPSDVGEPAAEIKQQVGGEDGWQVVRSAQAGYVQHIDAKRLLQWAVKHQAFVRIKQPIGAFVGEQELLCWVQPDTPSRTPLGEDELRQLRDWVVIAQHRNIEQDVAFGLQQLVDIALKALSPGVNDTTTAIMAVDQLGQLSQRLAGRVFPLPLRADEAQQPRVWVAARDFAGYLRLIFDLIRINAKGNHAVLRCLLRALARTHEAARSPARRQMVEAQADLLLSYAEQTLATDYEKQAVRLLHSQVRPQLQ